MHSLGEPQQVKQPFMVEKQIKKWSVDLFMNDHDEFMEEVTSVAVPDSGVLQNVPQCFLCSQSCFLLLENSHKKKEGVMQLFSSPAVCHNVMDEDVSNDEY